MIKKVYVIDDFSSSRINGIGTYINQLVYVYSMIGYEIYIIAYNYPCKTVCFKQYKNTTALCIPIIGITWDKYFNLISYFIRLNISDCKNNIFIFNYAISYLLLKDIKLSYCDSKFVYTIHDMSWTSFFNGDVERFSEIGVKSIKLDSQYISLSNNLENEIYMFSEVDQIISLTNVTGKLLNIVYNIDAEKIKIIPNGISDTFSPYNAMERRICKVDKKLKDNDVIILFVGRVHHSKGINQLVKAFEQIALYNRNIKLVIVGSLLPKSEFKITTDYSSKIIFTGFIGREELEKWYKIADVAVLPSFFEQCSFAGIDDDA